MRIGPRIAIRIRIPIARIRPASDKQRSRGTQRNQLVIVHRQIARVQRPSVTQKLAIEPVIQRRPRKVGNLLSVDVPV